MKKLLAFFAVALIGVIGAFAFDVTTVHGTWVDERYDADWTFSTAGKIILSYHSTGEVIYTFDDSNVKNFRVRPATESEGSGVVVQFRCDETKRNYKFICPPQLLKPTLEIEFQPDWAKGPYKSAFRWIKDDQ